MIPHGKDAKVLVDESDLSPFFNASNPTKTLEPGETTAYGNQSKTYIVGLQDGTISLGGMFDGDPGAVDEVLRGALGASANLLLTVAPGGLAEGVRVHSSATREVSYDVSAPVADVVGISAEAQADGGIDPAISLHDLVAETVTANGNGQDNGVATLDGGVGVLHVTATSGTGQSLVGKIQDSPDDVIYSDLITFTSTGASTAERVEVAGNVDRFVRARWEIAGTDPSFTFAIVFSRR